MNCPKPNCGGLLAVTHTYSAGPHGKVQRMQCCSCLKVVTAQTIIVDADPKRGQGAKALARKLSNEKRPDDQGVC